MPVNAAHRAAERTFVENSARRLATLIGALGDFNLAKDVMQEAFVVAMRR